MDKYGKRLFLVAMMFAAAALSATLPAAGKQQPSGKIGAVAAQTLSAARVEETESSEPVSEGFFVVLRTEAGRQVRLLRRTGETLQTVTADENGDATFLSVAPGRYRVESGLLGGEFCLWENAAVSAISGTLWSDGELLHLTETETVRLRLKIRTTAEQTGRVVTVSVTSIDGKTEYRSFVAGEPAACTVEFGSLRPGEYRVRVGGTVVGQITLSDESVQEIAL